jgi:SAM-dependent methyltransferase
VDDRLDAHLELAALPREELVRRAYRLVLRRDPEPGAADRPVSAATLLRELVSSEEFERLRALDDALAAALATEGSPRFLEAPAGSDERAVEIPWALARARGAARVLDVGSAHAEPAYLAALLRLGTADLVGVDAAEAEIPGMRTVVADVRSLPFEDGCFDVVLCVSTLEHVGRDNRVYGLDEERDAEGIGAALEELRRVLSPDGRLVATVPTGEPEDHGWFVQLDPDGWNARFVAAGVRVLEEEVYAAGEAGWRAAPSFDPADVRYRGGSSGAAAVLCVSLGPVSGARRLARRARAAVARPAAGGAGHPPPPAPRAAAAG